MDKVRLLKWEKDDDGDWYVVTKVGVYRVLSQNGYFIFALIILGFTHKRQMCADADLALDAAESDYLDRISEFVPVLKPGQVAVNEEDLRLVTENYFITDFLNIEIPCRGALSHVGDAFERIVESYQNQHPTPAPDAETGDKN